VQESAQHGIVDGAGQGIKLRHEQGGRIVRCRGSVCMLYLKVVR